MGQMGKPLHYKGELTLQIKNVVQEGIADSDYIQVPASIVSSNHS